MNTNIHINHLKYEVDRLKEKIQEHGTGHIKTAIQVLEQRIEELEEQMECGVLDSSYPDGDEYWK